MEARAYFTDNKDNPKDLLCYVCPCCGIENVVHEEEQELELMFADIVGVTCPECGEAFTVILK